MAEPPEISDRTRGVALPLAFLFGAFGFHRFYVGKTGTGLLQLGTLGGLGLWWLYDVIIVAAGEFRDGYGRRVVKWSATDPGGPRALPEQSEVLADEIEGLRAEMAELNERVDFMERLLTQARERGALPPR